VPEEGEYDYMRVHIATFDSITNTEDYNKFMCERVKGFFRAELQDVANPENHSNFWCEKGYYKK
jgi:hypothetical protein